MRTSILLLVVLLLSGCVNTCCQNECEIRKEIQAQNAQNAQDIHDGKEFSIPSYPQKVPTAEERKVERERRRVEYEARHRMHVLRMQLHLGMLQALMARPRKLESGESL